MLAFVTCNFKIIRTQCHFTLKVGTRKTVIGPAVMYRSETCAPRKVGIRLLESTGT